MEERRRPWPDEREERGADLRLPLSDTRPIVFDVPLERAVHLRDLGVRLGHRIAGEGDHRIDVVPNDAEHARRDTNEVAHVELPKRPRIGGTERGLEVLPREAHQRLEDRPQHGVPEGPWHSDRHVERREGSPGDGVVEDPPVLAFPVRRLLVALRVAHPVDLAGQPGDHHRVVVHDVEHRLEEGRRVHEERPIFPL